MNYSKYNNISINILAYIDNPQGLPEHSLIY